MARWIVFLAGIAEGDHHLEFDRRAGFENLERAIFLLGFLSPLLIATALKTMAASLVNESPT